MPAKTPSHRLPRATLLLTVLLAGTATTARAELLFSFTAGQGGSQPGVTDTLRYYLTYPDAGPVLFQNVVWTPADTGRTVTSTAASDPNFAPFTAQLTDGIPQDVTVWFTPAPAVNISGQGWPESRIVWNTLNDPRADAQSLPIARYTLTQNAFATTYDPATGRSTFTANITFSAYSNIPEPGTLSLTLSTLAPTLLRRRQSTARSEL